MPLTLFLHPLSSFCQKALIALYENETPFTPQTVDLRDEAQSAALRKLWPLRKFPVLRDGDTIVPESTSIIEYLARHHPGPNVLVPQDESALEVRAQDRFYDLHVHLPMQKVVGDRIRPADKKDPFGVEQARTTIDTALAVADKTMATRPWAAGERFSMADCAAAPALFYVDIAVRPLAGAYDNVAAYLGRLVTRPSFARALEEAKPYLGMLPR